MSRRIDVPTTGNSHDGNRLGVEKYFAAFPGLMSYQDFVETCTKSKTATVSDADLQVMLRAELLLLAEKSLPDKDLGHLRRRIVRRNCMVGKDLQRKMVLPDAHRRGGTQPDFSTQAADGSSLALSG